MISSINKPRNEKIKRKKKQDSDEINFDVDDINEMESVTSSNIRASQKDHSISSTSKKEDITKKSIVIRHLNDNTTIDELEALFSKFGIINKVTMMCDKYSGKSKGIAYVEYDNKDSQVSSLGMNQQLIKTRLIRVEDKKVEIPLHLGRREKCYNLEMEGYFKSTKNNFGPIRIKKSLRKSKYEPY